MQLLLSILLLCAVCTATFSSAPESQHALQLPSTPQTTTTHLHITAVRHRSSPSHHSYLQCLRLPTPFHTYTTVGASTFLSATSNATLVVLPPNSAEGWHKPPAPMWFFLLRGRSRVETPSTGDEVWIEPSSSESTGMVDEAASAVGKGERVERQIVLALDVLGKGHLTFYPVDEETVALQVPLGADWEDWVGGLEVVREGAC